MEENLIATYPQGIEYENAVTIFWNDEVYDDNGKLIKIIPHYELLDVISSKQITLNSELTSYPIASSPETNGRNDKIIDHKFDQPISVSISGTFALRGRNAGIDKNGISRLKKKQELFEKLKSDGILCTIITVNKKDMVFRSRKNMCLTSIRWDESLSSVGFDFTFSEIRLAVISETAYQKDATDPDLPNVTDGQKLDFTDVFLKPEDMVGMLVKLGIQDGFISNDYINHVMADVGVGAGYATAGVLATGLILKSGLSAIGALTAIGATGVGAVIEVGAALLVGVGLLAYTLWSKWKNRDSVKYRIKPFRYSKNADELAKTDKRFTEFVEQVYNQVKQLNDKRHVFGITSDEDQDCTRYVDGDPYYFSFKKETGSGYYNLKIQQALSSDGGDGAVIYNSRLVPLKSMADCTDGNNLFKKVDGWWVYIINEQIDSSDTAQKNSLKNCHVLVSPRSISKFNERIIKILRSAYRNDPS